MARTVYYLLRRSHRIVFKVYRRTAGTGVTSAKIANEEGRELISHPITVRETNIREGGENCSSQEALFSAQIEKQKKKLRTVSFVYTLSLPAPPEWRGDKFQSRLTRVRSGNGAVLCGEKEIDLRRSHGDQLIKKERK